MKKIGIIGAGPVGCLAGIYLAKRGYQVEIYERRPDPRQSNAYSGRSINLALSDRGILALEKAGLHNLIADHMVPMSGRMVHPLHGTMLFQPYGNEHQAIHSVSRGGLNLLLIESAAKEGITLHFNIRCLEADLRHTTATFAPGSDYVPAEAIDRTSLRKVAFDHLIAADGAFSAVRHSMQFADRFDYSQTYIEHGYKELHIPANADGSPALELHALHIWPRERFMLIALPNTDNSFTLTLFYPMEGENSFEKLTTQEAALHFMQQWFPDVVEKIPDVQLQFTQHPTSSLHLVHCYPWVKNQTLLIGDAAHAIVPFYGQGMNAGFEDCRVLNELLENYHDQWNEVLPRFQELRKPDGDAIAQLALDNFIEMRDLVDDPAFILRKKIEARLHQLYPREWIPLYSMVTFRADMRYSEALQTGRLQTQVMNEVLANPLIDEVWSTMPLEPILERFRQLKDESGIAHTGKVLPRRS